MDIRSIQKGMAREWQQKQKNIYLNEKRTREHTHQFSVLRALAAAAMEFIVRSLLRFVPFLSSEETRESVQQFVRSVLFSGKQLFWAIFVAPWNKNNITVSRLHLLSMAAATAAMWHTYTHECAPLKHVFVFAFRAYSGVYSHGQSMLSDRHHRHHH